MAREFGQLDAAAWREDEDWRRLPADGQWLYGLLISQGDFTAAGVLNLAVNRWRHMCADMTEERFAAAMAVLEDRRYIVVDTDTEELLVRSFARRKTQWSNPKRVGALRSAVAQMHSSTLRQALADELARIDKTVDGLTERPGDRLTETLTEPSPERMPIGLADVSSSYVSGYVTQTPDERIQTPDASPKRRPRKRATSAPDIFPITDSMRRYVAEHHIPSDVASTETDRFLNWHRAKGSTFIDWTAAWRTWMGKVTLDQSHRSRSSEDEPEVRGVGGLLLDSSML